MKRPTLRCTRVFSFALGVFLYSADGAAQTAAELEVRLKREREVEAQSRQAQIEAEVLARLEIERKRASEQQAAAQLGIAGQLIGTQWVGEIRGDDEWEDDNGRTCREQDIASYHFEFAATDAGNQVRISQRHAQNYRAARNSCYSELNGLARIDCTSEAVGLVPFGQTGEQFVWQARTTSEHGVCDPSEADNFTRTFRYSDGVLKYLNGSDEWIELYPE